MTWTGVVERLVLEKIILPRTCVASRPRTLSRSIEACSALRVGFGEVNSEIL